MDVRVDENQGEYYPALVLQGNAGLEFHIQWFVRSYRQSEPLVDPIVTQAVALSTGAELHVEDVDFGKHNTAFDNDPIDLGVGTSGLAAVYRAPDEATFSCTANGCGTPMFAPSVAKIASRTWVGPVWQATSWASLTTTATLQDFRLSGSRRKMFGLPDEPCPG